jgi:redox-sensitive bicupin YhaK (pirin superfamily)
MIIRRANERGITKINWLESFHTFSFGEYYDPKWIQYKNLRVVNEDFIKKDNGFPMHPHKNMEIITFLIQGELTHKDNLGNHEVIRPGEIQVMSAGTGIIHSELALAQNDDVHLLQIWILPNKLNIPPRYEQRKIRDIETFNQAIIVASGQNLNGNNLVMPLSADADIHYFKLKNNQSIKLNHSHYPNLYLHLIKGNIEVDGVTLGPSDEIFIDNIKEIEKHLKSNDNDVEFITIGLT